MCNLPSSFAEAKRVRFCPQQRIFIRCEHKVNHYNLKNLSNHRGYSLDTPP